MYNFENYLIQPFLSFLIGFFLLLGISSVGFFFIKFFLKKNTSLNSSFYLNSPLIGSNILLAILTPLAYFELLSLNLFRFISIIIIFFLIYFFFSNPNFFSQKKINKKDYPLYILIILFFLLSIAPVTHADSVAYHMLGAVNFLIDGNLLKDLLPSEIKLAGPGELLIALGLSFGSEQLGGLVQFSSIFTIIYAFKNFKKNPVSKLLLLSAITTPTFIFFMSSPKPQLMQISNVLLCSFIIYKIFKNEYSNILIKKFIYLIVFILALNMLVKFSFILSSTILFLVLFAVLFKIKKINYLIGPLISSGLILILPKIIFYQNYFNTNIIYFFKSSLPINLSLYQTISESLSKITEGKRNLPTWLVYPHGLGSFSAMIGPAFLSFLLFRIEKSKELLIVILLGLLFILIVLNYGQSTSRFIFEGYLVVQLFLLLTQLRGKNILKFLEKYVYFQCCLAIIILTYFVFNLTPGIFSKNMRSEVMQKNANGYELMTWVNNNLEKNEQIISSHRSLSLINNKSYSLIFLNYLNKNSPDFKEYVNYIKKNNVNKALIHEGFKLGNFKNCVKEKISTIDNIEIFIGRNPFNKKSKERSASIYNIDLNNLENCFND